MKTAVFALLAAAATARLVHDDAFLADLQSKLSESGATWTAHHNPHFEGWTLEQAARLQGTKLAEQHKLVQALPKRSYGSVSVPTSFDERTAWPNCTIMQEVRDQASCGSCWAFGTVEAFNDRRCVSNNGSPESNTMLSAQDVTSCCSGFTCFGCQGCDGGMPATAWQYLVNKGVVSGGDYGTTSTCLPYELQPCEHHVAGPRPNCSEGGSTPSCTQTCISSYSKSWSQDKRNAKSAFGFNSLEDVQASIMKEGAVTASFSVYADFLSYKSGVYQHQSGELLGGHAISIIGWGEENGTPYWLVRNSWNTDWGNKGYFKILRGQDECGIEEDIVAGDA